ncbi:MAG: McrB family protein [Verrucomicrobiales bacterium]
MNLWIAPAADEASFKNITRSLNRPVDAKTLSEFGLPSPLCAWGARLGPKTSRIVLQGMKAGDICFFYTQSSDHSPKKFNWAGRIVGTRQSKTLAAAIWEDPSFELVYLMDEVWPIALSVGEWAEISGYAPNPPLGLSRVAENAVSRIEKTFGSIDKFAKSLDVHAKKQDPPTPLPPINKSTSIATSEIVHSNLSAIDGTRYIHEYASRRGFNFGIAPVRRLFSSMRSKPFVILAGNSGTGKSRLVRLFAEASGATVANGRFVMIPVKPDWNDSSELLGYFDLTGDYIPGHLIGPLLSASHTPTKPFFVCLDEMNLARVEHYFSDFLSIVESRRKEGPSVVTDPILREAQLDKMPRQQNSWVS